MKKVDMYSKQTTYGSPTEQCYSYATCANLSNADGKSTSNEWSRVVSRAGLGPGSGLSFSKCFGPILGLHTKPFHNIQSNDFFLS